MGSSMTLYSDIELVIEPYQLWQLVKDFLQSEICGHKTILKDLRKTQKFPTRGHLMRDLQKTEKYPTDPS